MAEKRHRSLVGDIFEIQLPNGGKRYLQFIGWDKTVYGLGGDVVRVFKKNYAESGQPSLAEIVIDEVEFYAHIYHITIGTKAGLWKRFGNFKQNMGKTKPFFYQGPSYPTLTESSWIMWQMDGEHWETTKEKIMSGNADMGGVMPPKSVYERILNGRYLKTDPHYIR